MPRSRSPADGRKDLACRASSIARAAWRLETLGYEAHDYVAGKQEWLAFDLPHEWQAILAGDQATCRHATGRTGSVT